MSKIKLLDWREVINRDFPPVEVTKATIRRCIEYGLAVRRPYESRAYETWREKVLSTPLP